MGILRKTTVKVPTQSYADRLSDIKSIFQSAHCKASALSAEMQSEIENKKVQIAALNEQIKEISATQTETNKFVSSLEKFI